MYAHIHLACAEELPTDLFKRNAAASAYAIKNSTHIVLNRGARDANEEVLKEQRRQKYK